jgi:hypothetical protein
MLPLLPSGLLDVRIPPAEEVWKVVNSTGSEL